MKHSSIDSELRELRHRFRSDRQGALDEFSKRYGDPLRRVIGRALREDPSMREGLRSTADANGSTMAVIVREIEIAILTLAGECECDQGTGETIRGAKQETVRLAGRGSALCERGPVSQGGDSLI